jgi:hypothetical protein
LQHAYSRQVTVHHYNFSSVLFLHVFAFMA